MSTGTDEEAVASLMAAQTSGGRRLTRSVRLAVWARGSIAPASAISATSAARPASANSSHFMAVFLWPSTGPRQCEQPQAAQRSVAIGRRELGEHLFDAHRVE